MAIVVRYFSTSSAGAADGTSWANRAALFDGSNTWASIIDDFDFSGSDSLECRIGPGSYTCAEWLTTSICAPTAANPLILRACNSDGTLWEPPDPNWTSDQPVWSSTGMPVIAASGNVTPVDLAAAHLYGLKFTASARNANVIGTVASMQWCIVEQSTANAAATAVTSVAAYRVNDCAFKVSSSQYSAVWSATSTTSANNVRVEGNPSASAGVGIALGSTTGHPRLFTGCCVFNNKDAGISITASGTGNQYHIERCVVANNGADGITLASVASQTGYHGITRCMITGNTGDGIDAQSAAHAIIRGNRLRDNANGIVSAGNYPTDLNNYTTDSDDATEYVNAAGGDFRIKAGATIHGKGYGVSEQWNVPAVGDVQSGVQYGENGTEYTGTFGVPATTDVKNGVQYGAGGTEYTGSYTAAGGGGCPLVGHGGLVL